MCIYVFARNQPSIGLIFSQAALSRIKNKGWRDGSVVRACLLFQRTGVLFLSPKGSSQPLVTPVPKDLTPSCGFCCHCTHVMQTRMQAKAQIRKIQVNTSFLKKKKYSRFVVKAKEASVNFIILFFSPH